MTSLIVFDFLDSPTQATETTGINFEKAFLFISPAAEMREMCDRSLRESSQLILKALFIDSIFSLIKSSHFILHPAHCSEECSSWAHFWTRGYFVGLGRTLWIFSILPVLARIRCIKSHDIISGMTLSSGCEE